MRIKPRRISSAEMEQALSKIDTAIADGSINESFSRNGVTVRRTTASHISGYEGYTVENRVSRERFSLSDRAKVAETATTLINIPAMTNRELEEGLKKRQAK